MLRALTSLSGTFALNVDVAPLPVLLQRAALLVAATAVVALEGLLDCERQKLQKITKQAHTQRKKTNPITTTTVTGDTETMISWSGCAQKLIRMRIVFTYDSRKLKANEFEMKKTGWLFAGCHWKAESAEGERRCAKHRRTSALCVRVKRTCGRRVPEWVRRCPLRASRRRQA